MDTWINTLTQDSQVSPPAVRRSPRPHGLPVLSQADTDHTRSPQRAPMSSERSSAHRAGTGRQRPSRVGVGAAAAQVRRAADVPGRTTPSRPRDQGSSPTRPRDQGSAPSRPHPAARRSLQKSPYLRFSSPSPPCSRRHPRLVERVRGQTRSGEVIWGQPVVCVSLPVSCQV